jgi:hypothetical protein
LSEIVYETTTLIGYILADFVSFVDGVYPGLILIFMALLVPMIVYTIYKIVEDSITYEG